MNKAKLNYVSVIPHPELPSAFLSTFGVTGLAPEWVMDRGQKKTFGSKEEAELAGYRCMMIRLNRPEGSQVATARGSIRAVRDLKTDRRPPYNPERDRIFANFGTKNKED